MKTKLIPINAGYFKLDGGAMFGVVPKVIWNRLNAADENNLCTWAMRCLLVDNGTRRILIDTGMGDKQSEKFFSHYSPSGPTLIDSLAERGYKPEDITDVFLTHLHFDHCGGGVRYEDGDASRPVLTFQNALYWSNARHWSHALSPNSRERASFLEENILPIHESGRLRFIAEESGLWIPGIRVEVVHGHTDSQMLPIIAMDDGTELMFMADLIASVHHIKSAYVMGYDMRPLETMEEKERLLSEAVSKKSRLFFEHDPVNETATVEGSFGRYSVVEILPL
jgi:glyoxylase-like metal-dependent hydrolase (beta-lactamase superfamily II)